MRILLVEDDTLIGDGIKYSAANYLIPICILFDTDKKQTTANYLIPNPPLFDGF